MLFLFSLFLNTAPGFVKIKPDDRMGIIHKAYAAELDRQIKQEMKEKHPELFEMQKENKVDTDSILGYNTDNNWAKDNGIITVREQEDFYSKVMSINTGTHFEKTKNGLYIIPTGDEYGVNNTLIFTDGDTVNPSIEKVVKISLDNETSIDEVRRYIYGQEISEWNFASEIANNYFGEGVVQEYTKSDFYNIRSAAGRSEGRTRQENIGDNRQQPDGRGDTGKSNETVENYLGENIYAYADEDRGGYSITLANGKKRKIVFRKAKGKWKYMVDGKVYSSIEERIREENRLLYSKNRLEE